MSAAFVITAWCGKLHTAVDHIGPSLDRPLGQELARIPLSEAGAHQPLWQLKRQFAAEVRQAKWTIES